MQSIISTSVKFAFNASHLHTNKFSVIRKFSSNRDCPCKVSLEKVTQSLQNKDFNELRNQASYCQKVIDFSKKWNTYGISCLTPISQQNPCQLIKISEALVIPELQMQPDRIKQIDKQFVLSFHEALSCFALKPNTITLAGEGGAIVGQKSHWEFALEMLNENRQRHIRIVSIGGAQGYDAKAIADVFLAQGFNVMTPIVVDPNPIAAFLSGEQNVESYVTISQEYFDKSFKRQENGLYIFHLGTTLNVVKKNIASQILEDVVVNMTLNDILSIIVVDEHQFKTVRHHLVRGESNKAGFAEYHHKDDSRHYKTVLSDLDKFIHFTKNLGLEGTLVNTKLGGVAFIAYKSLKMNK